MKHTGNAEIDTSTAEWVIGSDECGLGSWAGPLVVCGAILPRNWRGEAGDSKSLSALKRRRLFELFTRATPVPYHLEVVESERVDEIGVQAALLGAHRAVLEALLARVQGTALVVVDGFPHGTHSIGVPGAIGLPAGDRLVHAVSVASIIGKVTHDERMTEYAKQYPGYDFESNMGYRSVRHEAGLAKLGPCAIHRKSYAPIAKLLKSQSAALSLLD